MDLLRDFWFQTMIGAVLVVMSWRRAGVDPDQRLDLALGNGIRGKARQ
jgi:hypothetical protein